MSNKQFFAQVGIFILLGLNVAAYYVFWPTSDRWSMSEVNASGQEKTSLKFGEDKKSEGETQEPPAGIVQIPTLPDLPQMQLDRLTRDNQADAKEKEIRQMLEKAKQVKGAFASFQPPPPAFVVEPSALAPESGANDPPKIAPGITPTSGVAPKIQSPWLLQMEVVGAQTQLVAQLQQKSTGRSLASFKILCDRLEMKAPDGALQAVGKVTFTGAGLKGTCRRLTLPLSDLRIIFEEDVVIRQESTPMVEEPKNSPSPPGNQECFLRGERILWELPMVETKTNEVSPATFQLPLPSRFPPAILEGPR